MLGIALSQVYENVVERIATAHSGKSRQTLSSMVFGDGPAALCLFICELWLLTMADGRRLRSGFQMENIG